jgi:hypothetical protein
MLEQLWRLRCSHEDEEKFFLGDGVLCESGSLGAGEGGED